MANNNISSKKPPMALGKPGGSGGFSKPKNFKLGLKYCFSFIKQYWLCLIVCLIFSVGSAIFAVISPTWLEKMTNSITKNYVASSTPDANAWTDIVYYAIIMVIFYVSSFLCLVINSFIIAFVGQRTAKKLRSQVLNKVDRVPLSYFDTTQIGDTLSLVTNDVDAMSQAVTNSFSTVITSAVQVIALLIIMFIKNWILAIICVGATPINLIIIGVFMSKSQKVFFKNNKDLANLNSNIEEIYGAHNIVKVFEAQDISYQEFSKMNKALYHSSKMSQILNTIMMPIMFIMSNICQVLIFLVGIILCINGSIELGVVIGFVSYFHLFNNSFSQIGQMTGQILTCTSACERIGLFLDIKEMRDETNVPSLLKYGDKHGNIQFKKVKFGYLANKIIIKNFSLDVKRGQKIAIVGPTGAGKTTIVNLLMRFYNLNDGKIIIDGVEHEKTTASNVRTLFSMVLQDTWLFNGTIYDNIVFNKKNVKMEDVIDACKQANVHHFIETLPKGYQTIINENSNISAGEKQLLTIARAILQNSPMLILDEATSSVDTRTEELIQKAMDNLSKNKTSFIIAHRLSTIKNADVILVLKDGDIIEQGSHEVLLKKKKGFYASLYNAQFSL